MFADDKNVRLENDKRVKNYVEYYFSEGMLKHLLRIKPERDFYDEFVVGMDKSIYQQVCSWI